MFSYCENLIDFPMDILKIICHDDNLDACSRVALRYTCKRFLNIVPKQKLFKTQFCHLAASYNYLVLLQWSRLNRAPWNNLTCANAASNGHLEVLKWLRKNGCPWDEDVCANAVSNGHLEILKWAR